MVLRLQTPRINVNKATGIHLTPNISGLIAT